MPATAAKSKGMEVAGDPKAGYGWSGLALVKPVTEYDITERQRLLKLWTHMRLVRSSWMSSWREIIEYVLPYLGRFVNSDTNRGDRKDQSIINNTATRAVTAASAGMQSGLTSPGRPWFRFALPDVDLQDDDEVSEWLHDAEQAVLRYFQQSNLYTSLEQVYLNLVGPGTACLFIEEDDEEVFRFFSVPIGQFMLGTDQSGRVNRVAHEARFTVIQTVERFGLENCSPGVQNAYREHLYDRFVDVLHVIEPNDDQDVTLPDYRGMAFRSAWIELASTDVSGIITMGDSAAIGFLKRSGYREFPAVCPRWSATGEDAYGHSPSWDAIGDIKALQLYEIAKADQVAKVGKPPLIVPDTMRHQVVSMLPGTATYVPANGQNAKIEPMVQVHPAAIQATLESIKEHETRIKDTYLYNLWLAISNDERDQRATAAEINARQQEKMLQLGQVLTRFNDEALDPLFDRVIPMMMRRGLLPKAPRKLLGRKLRPEYISILNQAQKAVQTTAIERGVGFVSQLAQSTQDPSVLDNLDKDAIARKYFDAVGIQPNLMHSADQVAQLRAQRAKQQAAAQAQQAVPAMAKAAKDASGAQLDSNNALTRILSALGPVAAAGTPAGPNEPPPANQ
jgi:hypothetical protein